MNSIAIMQPYFFPYVGYFQLLMAVDTFIFYDDVNFIKRGWINRNKILLNGSEYLISIPCKKASQNDLINETEVNYDHPVFKKLEKTFYHAYSKAPNFDEVKNLFDKSLQSGRKTIADVASSSIIAVCEYLDLDVKFKKSSLAHKETAYLGKADRLIAITKEEGFSNYVNSIGGKAIYNKEYFKKNGVSLYFLEPSLIPYNQPGSDFIEGLSILDLLMFEGKDRVIEILQGYTLT